MTDETTENTDSNDKRPEAGESILYWLLPLLLLLLLIALGFWFCSGTEPRTPPLNTSNGNENTVLEPQNTNAKTIPPSFSIKADGGRYTVTGVVPDEAERQQIVDALTSQFGAANLDLDGFRLDSGARAFPSGWRENLAKVIPELKDWHAGTLSFSGNTIAEAAGLPEGAVIQLKKLFGGWKLPFSLAGANAMANEANLEALDKLNKAGSIDDVVAALNISIINFASGSSEIPASAQPVIEKAAEELRKHPANVTVEIGGHTDSDGDSASNLRLSRSRADSVKKALVARGVSDRMLTAKGYGETRPIAPNDTLDNKFKNRRIEYKTDAGN